VAICVCLECPSYFGSLNILGFEEQEVVVEKESKEAVARVNLKI